MNSGSSGTRDATWCPKKLTQSRKAHEHPGVSVPIFDYSLQMIHLTNTAAVNKLYDITRTISESTAVWPGDAQPRLEWSARMEKGSSVNIGVISISTHMATHVDAPLHYQMNGASVDRYPLELFVGPALLIDLAQISVIGPDDLTEVPHGTERLLVRTRQSELRDDEWRDNITYFSVEAIDMLADRGVKLIGSDAPSFDPTQSRELPAHHALARHGIANLENLQLRNVPLGHYLLFALPLKVLGMDAAPVRAILLPT